MKLVGRIGVTDIFKRHIQTFYDYGFYQFNGKRKVPFSDKFTFLFLPFCFAIGLEYLDPQIISTHSELIITCLSIFIGLLFNLLTLIFDLAKKEKDRLYVEKGIAKITNDDKAAFILIKESFVNTAYAIVLSILCVSIIFISKFRPILIINYLKNTGRFGMIKETTLAIADIIIIFLLLQFLFTLLMILRRFFIIFNKQVEAEDTENALTEKSD